MVVKKRREGSAAIGGKKHPHISQSGSCVAPAYFSPRGVEIQRSGHSKRVVWFAVTEQTLLLERKWPDFCFTACFIKDFQYVLPCIDLLVNKPSLHWSEYRQHPSEF